MPTTPSGHATKPRPRRKTPRKSPKKKRPIDRVTHDANELDPIEAAIDRRLPARALRLRIKRLTDLLRELLGPRGLVWIELEAGLNELKSLREEAYFDLGFEHGFAAGRSAARRRASNVRDFSARLRDLAIQQCSHEDALVAVLDAAYALAVPPAQVGATRGEKTKAGARKRYDTAARVASSASVVRDAERSLH